MDTRLRNIDLEDWKEFKLGCFEEGISCNKKILELISAYAKASRTIRKARLIADLDELNQKKLFEKV